MPSLTRDSASGQPLFNVATDVGNGLRPEVVLKNSDGSDPVLGLPAGATSVNATSGVQANATATASMPAVASKRNYITGFEITGSGATAAAAVTATLTGLMGGATMNYAVTAVAGAALANPSLIVSFPIPIPASAVNTAIDLSVPALGAGNTRSMANIHGFVV
jgi:hypothetical protein